jgi:hypothetical protein
MTTGSRSGMPRACRVSFVSPTNSAVMIAAEGMPSFFECCCFRSNCSLDVSYFVSLVPSRGINACVLQAPRTLFLVQLRIPSQKSHSRWRRWPLRARLSILLPNSLARSGLRFPHRLFPQLGNASSGVAFAGSAEFAPRRSCPVVWCSCGVLPSVIATGNRSASFIPSASWRIGGLREDRSPILPVGKLCRTRKSCTLLLVREVREGFYNRTCMCASTRIEAVIVKMLPILPQPPNGFGIKDLRQGGSADFWEGGRIRSRPHRIRHPRVVWSRHRPSRLP